MVKFLQTFLNLDPDPDYHQNLLNWVMSNDSTKFHADLISCFFSNPVNRQTENRHRWKITSFAEVTKVMNFWVNRLINSNN